MNWPRTFESFRVCATLPKQSIPYIYIGFHFILSVYSVCTCLDDAFHFSLFSLARSHLSSHYPSFAGLRIMRQGQFDIDVGSFTPLPSVLDNNQFLCFSYIPSSWTCSCRYCIHLCDQQNLLLPRWLHVNTILTTTIRANTTLGFSHTVRKVMSRAVHSTLIWFLQLQYLMTVHHTISHFAVSRFCRSGKSQNKPKHTFVSLT